MRKFINIINESERIVFDVADLKRRYDHYNNLLFDGKLPDIPLEYSKLKSVGGQVLAKTKSERPLPRSRLLRQRVNATLIPGSLKMQISTLYQRDEQAIDKILLHEMIHVYFISNGDFYENHGWKFLEMRRRLSAKVGFDIPVKDNVEGLELTDAPTRNIGLILMMDRAGPYRFAIFSEAYMLQNLEGLRQRWEGLLRYDRSITEVRFLITSGRIESAVPLQRKKNLSDIGYRPCKPRAAEMIDEAIANASKVLTVVKRPASPDR